MEFWGWGVSVAEGTSRVVLAGALWGNITQSLHHYDIIAISYRLLAAHCCCPFLVVGGVSPACFIFPSLALSK